MVCHCCAKQINQGDYYLEVRENLGMHYLERPFYYCTPECLVKRMQLLIDRVRQ